MHNSGSTKSTAEFRPWKVVVAIWLEEKCEAIKLEKYLKTGSGRALIKKRFGV